MVQVPSRGDSHTTPAEGGISPQVQDLYPVVAPYATQQRLYHARRHIAAVLGERAIMRRVFRLNGIDTVATGASSPNFR